MATPDVDTQLATLRTRLGEPEDADQARWSPTQILDALNASRNEVAEQTRCYQVKDRIAFTVAGSLVAPVSQALPAAGSPMIVSAANDFIWLEVLTWEGRPLRIVRPENWREVIGDDDTVVGNTPTVAKWFGRQIQVFNVPDAAGALEYEGWAYPPYLVAGGVDASFTTRPADVAIWHAAMVLKGSDERKNDHEEKMFNRGIAVLTPQYKPKGPRFVRTGDVFVPTRPVL